MKLIQCCFLNLSYVLDSRKNLLWKRHNKITSTRKVLLQHTDSNSFLNLPFPSFPQSSLFCCLGVLWAWALHRFPGALHRSPPKASLMSSLQHFSICVWLFDGNLSPTKCNTSTKAGLCCHCHISEAHCGALGHIMGGESPTLFCDSPNIRSQCKSSYESSNKISSLFRT